MAGTITSTISQFGSFNSTLGMYPGFVITANCTADAADGSFPATVLARTGADLANTDGLWLQQMVTNPGSTAPQDNYDITITDVDGVDLLGGAGANRDTANSEVAFPTITARPLNGNITLTITNNNVNSATVVVKVFLGPIPTAGTQPVA